MTDEEVLQSANPEPLPEPVRRWLDRAIAGTAQPRDGARWSMHGEIKIGKWQPFTARQVISPRGFVWTAAAGRFPMRIRGFDRYTDGRGQMRWKLFGLFPIISATGPDVTRSAAGRLAGELMLVPGAVTGAHVTWRADDAHHATAIVTTDSFVHHVTVHIDDEGQLRTITLPRWGNPGNSPFAEHTFGVELDGEATFDGYTIPTRLRAGWWYGTGRWGEGEFFRATIEHAEFVELTS